MSNNKITFLEQFYPSGILLYSDPNFEILRFCDLIEVTKFLSNLEIDKIYVVTFELLSSWMDGDIDSPSISLSKPILITKNSNPRVISNYLEERIQLACNSFYLNDSIIEDNNDGLAIILKYKEINLF